MDAAKFKKLSDYFEKACQLDERERDAFVGHVEKEDVELGEELARLLAAHETRDDAFDDAQIAIPHDLTSPLSASHQPATMPERIGRYRIIRIIGEGGMGTVYLAEQTEPVQREVALKVIRPGMNSRAVVSRFESERQVLAMMDHPGLSKILDGGMTDSGLPYFVMEYVSGEPITNYCDSRRLSATDRVQLFIRVCDAVQHAHMKGIIHRDLKPSNILVEDRPDGPLPRVIDFGIAKALHGPLADRTLATLEGAMLGTPAYMSPEQADDRAAVVDTRSDVYALGAILYELLSGIGVIDTEAVQTASLFELRRLICDTEPPRPSTRFSQLSHEKKSHISERFGVEPLQHRRRLTGDLDWIVMRCLEKDPSRRYDGPHALASDLQRSLNNEPVLAGPPTTGYRMRKFIARHRAGVVAAALVGAALVAATAISLRFAISEAAQRRIIERKSEEMARVVEFQGDMLTAVNPVTMGLGIVQHMREQLDAAMHEAAVDDGDRVRLKESFEESLQYTNPTDVARRAIDETFLRRAVDAIEVKFSDQPLVEASLRHTLAEIYQEIGSFGASAAQSQRALALRRELLGDDHLDTLRTRRQLAWIERILHDDLSGAESQLRDVLAHLDRTSAPHHGEIIKTQYRLASMLLQMARLPEAEAILQEAVNRAKQHALPDSAEVIASLADLGLVQIHMGRVAEGERILEEARTRSESTLGPDHPTSLRILNDYSQVLVRLGRAEEAHHFQEAAYEGRRRVLGADHPYTLLSLANLGQSFRRLGRLEEAEACYRESIAGNARFYGPYHTNTIAIKHNLAVFYQHARRFEEADQLLREVIEARSRLHGPNHPSTFFAIDSYCGLLSQRGLLEESEACFRDAVERCREMHGDGHEASLRLMYSFATILLLREKYDETEPLLVTVVQGQSDLFGPAHDATLGTERLLARVLIELGRFADADRLTLDTYARHVARFGKNDERSRAVAARIEDLYKRWHEAEPDGGHDLTYARWLAMTAEASD